MGIILNYLFIYFFLLKIKLLHLNQIRVILELNPTVTSDQYRWPLNNNDSNYYEQFYIDPGSSKASKQVSKKILNCI